MFPAGIINYHTNPTGTDATSAVLSSGFTHSAYHASYNDEIEAIETYLYRHLNNGARAYLAANMTGVVAPIQQITLDAESFDVGGNFASYTYTVPVTGLYIIQATIAYANTTTVDGNQYGLIVRKNGSSLFERYVSYDTDGISTGTATPCVNEVAALVAADVITLFTNFTGANQTIFGGAQWTNLTILPF